MSKNEPEYDYAGLDPNEFLRSIQDSYNLERSEDTKTSQTQTSLIRKTLTRKSRTALIVTLILLAGITYLVWSDISSRPKEEAERRLISDMARKYNADIEWKGKLENLDKFYVADIQEALINKESRPVLLNVRVEDVIKVDNKNIIHFVHSEASEPYIRFILECNPEHTNGIIESRGDSPDYAVIALVSSVRRLTPEDNVSNAEDSEMFIANGRCLDLLLVNY